MRYGKPYRKDRKFSIQNATQNITIWLYKSTANFEIERTQRMSVGPLKGPTDIRFKITISRSISSHKFDIEPLTIHTHFFKKEQTQGSIF